MAKILIPSESMLIVLSKSAGLEKRKAQGERHKR
jgi:hypothetical protein